MRCYSVEGSTFQTFNPKKLKGSTFWAFSFVEGSTLDILPPILKSLHFIHFTLSFKGSTFQTFYYVKGSTFQTFYSVKGSSFVHFTPATQRVRASVLSPPYGLDRRAQRMSIVRETNVKQAYFFCKIQLRSS